MKPTTPSSGDPPQDFSRGCLRLSRARENGMCQLLGTARASVPGRWRRHPGGAVGAVRQGVGTATLTGTPTLHPVPGSWHRSTCLLYTSDAADEEDSVDLGGRRIIK